MYRFSVAIVATVILLAALPAAAQITLGTAQSFAVLGGSTVTNTGTSAINGNVGVSPGTAVTGFPPGVITGGAIHAGDATALQAQSDLTTAYNAVAGAPCNADLTGQNLGGLVLTPGVYCFASTAGLTGTLTLDFQGNPNALFLFQIGSTLTTASGSSVLLINDGGATCPPNVYWQVGSSATLGTGSTFPGNILALTSITVTTGAHLNGRALASNGAVTLDTNTVALCGTATSCPLIGVSPATLPNGSVGTGYSATITASGGTGPYTFAVTSGSLPTGLALAGGTGAITGTPTTAGTYNFTITATDTATGCLGSRAYTLAIAGTGCAVLTLAPAVLPPGNVGFLYNQTLSTTGGTGASTYSIVSGSLPGGLILNPSTGNIAGTPTTAGLFNFTVRAVDGNLCPGTRSYAIAVAAAIVPAGAPTLGLTGLILLSALLAGTALIAMNRSGS